MMPLSAVIDVPMSDVGIIAGILGAFFLLIAFYKSMFHSRKTPDEMALEAMEAQRKKDAEDALRVNLSNPYTPPASGAASPEETRDKGAETQSSTVPAEPGKANRPPALSAFRRLSSAGNITEVQQRRQDMYEWE